MAEATGQDEPWDQESQERDRRERWSRTTPSERLSWLERAIRFAGSMGTLPRRRP
ncbi:MAG: hypothetical protein AVDCRST_MAG76-73 [uncultured Acidimicrobiales bacterium]|uniref:Uncharacterized protein n=1 Tax=uncultured Acidimicrobiales bacterium TaxID=310071 RepID=A0A6J4GYF8_9ACTN|nr:MAG: hypothetical protein AVDCRST_MAG76-73 [uncultured Acidimicrobiales bacterium]